MLFKVQEIAGQFRVVTAYRNERYYAGEVLAVFAKRYYAENAARELNAEELQFSAEAEAAHERRQLGSFGV